MRRGRVSRIPQKSHLLVFLLVIADDLGGGHAHLHSVDDKLPGSLQSLAGEVLRRGQKDRGREGYIMAKTRGRFIFLFLVEKWLKKKTCLSQLYG